MNQKEAPRKKKKEHNFNLPKLPKPGKPTKITYVPFPTPEARRSINYTNISAYVQHRMQDRGRAIAKGANKREMFMFKEGNVWTFMKIISKGENPGNYTYIVTWDGLGQPPAGVSSTTFSQGKSYTKDGITKTLEGKPDQYTWAVWFLVNGIPPAANWPPIPSKNQSWTLDPPWPEYPLS